LQGNEYQGSSDWLTLTATITFPEVFSSAGEHYIIIFSCSENNITWDCHATTNHPDGFWQLFVYDKVSLGQIKTIYALNIGGLDYTASNGIVFEDDTQFAVGSAQTIGTTVSGTPDPDLYHTFRQRNELIYALPVSAGTYSVRLYFTEPTWSSAIAYRVMDVFIEDELVLDNLDIFATTGKRRIAFESSFVVEVSDSEINIAIVNVGGSTTYAVLSAIYINGMGKALVPTCNDGVQNQGEEGIDCGGPCAACVGECLEGETRSCSIAFGFGREDCVGLVWNGCHPVSCNEGYRSNGLICEPESNEWFVTLIDENCMSDTMRAMGMGIYDLFADRSLTTYMCDNGDAYYAYINHSRSNTWSPGILVGDSSHQVDSHNYPQIAQTFDGNYHIFYGAHGEIQYHARTTVPHDVNSWVSGPVLTYTHETLGEIESFDNVVNYNGWFTGINSNPFTHFSYIKSIVTRNGDIFMIYRNSYPTGYKCGDTHPVRLTSMARSKDNGRTWENPQEVIHRINCTDGLYLNEIYLSPVIVEPIRENVPERWHFIWTLAGGAVHDEYHSNRYHAIFQPSNEHWFAMDGTDLGVMVDENEMNSYCLMYVEWDPSYAIPFSVNDNGQPLVGNGMFYDGNVPWPSRSSASYPENVDAHEFKDGLHYAFSGGNIFYTAGLGSSWHALSSVNRIPGGTSGGHDTVPFTAPYHPAATMWVKHGPAYDLEGRFGKVINVVGQSSSLIGQKLVVVPGNRLTPGTTVSIYAYILDEDGARVDDDNSIITFAVQGGVITGATSLTATNGMVQTTVRVGTNPFLKIWVSNAHLQGYFYQADIVENNNP
jgi:hypothetical protein